MTLLASSYPFLNILWSMIIFCLMVIWVGFVIWILIDNFRRQDHSGWAKVMWLLFIMFVPVIGAICYILSRPVMLDGATA